MAVPLLDLEAQYAEHREELDAAVRDVVASQRFVLGPVVERFEDDVAAFAGTRHAVGCASGTDALLLALRALELEPGSEVVVPAFTFFATAGAVWNAGLRPVFADVDPRTFNLTAETVAAALSERTRAVIAVHLFGRMAPMSPLLELAEREGLALIEDAAQSFGARQRIGGEWRAAGAVGAAGCYSFFPTKNLGGWGDGGMVVSDDEELAGRVRALRVHGGRQTYRHDLVGTNSRLDALQAAVLAAKLPHVERWVERRRAHARAYGERLAELASSLTTPVVGADDEHAFNQYTVRAERRDELRAWLDERGIGTGVYYPAPLHLQPCFAELGYRDGDLPVSERATREVISLPMYPELTAGQIGQVAERVGEFYGG